MESACIKDTDGRQGVKEHVYIKRISLFILRGIKEIGFVCFGRLPVHDLKAPNNPKITGFLSLPNNM